ncbi:MAG: Flp pilus assembly protein CpaB [Lamprobacter sp.]|uniref:Flp pilus assembly protein CpaB n=1 Tax=Lamprobacter sp. TaxID=3100796 RepID=UPI002B2593FA|nr:Flp pilus assembly protein CpaB [Lamprobacter sp.]MEA3640840.1 Flp pilus assembly protein CpaB [Lamprobacter sp.]
MAVILIALVLASGVAWLINEWMDTQQAQVARTEAELRAERERLQSEMDRVAKEQARLEAERGKVPEPQTVSVLVAARDLPVRTRISRDDVSLRQIVSTEKPPEDALTQPSEVLGNFVIREIAAGQTILSTWLTEETALSLASRISDGNRAVTIDIDRNSDQLKLIEPGSRVDALVVSNSSTTGAVILKRLSNIKVLAVGRILNRDQEDLLDSEARSVTLEVDRDQAEFLARATGINDNAIKLVVRGQYNDSKREKLETEVMTLIRGTEQCLTTPGRDCR